MNTDPDPFTELHSADNESAQHTFKERAEAAAADAKAKVGEIAHNVRDRAVDAEQRAAVVVREHPAKVVMAVAAVGCVVALLMRAAAPPPPPRSRALRLLEEIKDRLTDLSEPAYEGLHDAADASSSAFRRGMRDLKHSSLGRRLSDLV